MPLCLSAAHCLEILKVDILVAEAIEAYKAGELQKEVAFIFSRMYLLP